MTTAGHYDPAYDWAAAPGRWRPKLLTAPNRRLGVHVTDTRAHVAGLGYQVMATGGQTTFPPNIARRIHDLIRTEGAPPPAMRFKPIPKPTCICLYPPGTHAPNCHRKPPSEGGAG